MKLSIILFILFFLVILPAHALAQMPSLAMTVSPSPGPSPTPVSVNYTLPYPGILADNPLYPLKTLRDNIIGWLISNPLKKAKFDLLQSDKRLQIGVYLIQKDKTETSLAASTISKGENYLTEAVNKAKQAKKQGEVTNDLFNTLHTAILKHEEVLKMLKDEVAASQKDSFTRMYTSELELDKQLPHAK